MPRKKPQTAVAAPVKCLAGTDEYQAQTETDYVEELIAVIERAKAKQGQGRPIAFTPGKLRRLFAALERGNFPEHACDRASIPLRTFRDWVDAGTEDTTESTPQWWFAQAVRLAEAIWTDAMVGVVNDAAKSHPRFYMAAIIALSRRQRKHWAEQANAPVQNGFSVAIGVQVQVRHAQELSPGENTLDRRNSEGIGP